MTFLMNLFVLLEVLESESSEDNIEGKRKVPKKITVEPLDEEKEKRTQYSHTYIKQFLIYSVKFFYPAFYVMFLTGYFLYYLILF